MIIGRQRDDTVKQSDILAAAGLAERTADAFESDQIPWAKEAFLSEDGGSCVVGGLMRMELGGVESLKGHLTSNTLDPIPRASDEVRRRISLAVDCDTYDWNDDDARTKEEIVDILKIVAKDLRNEASPGDGRP